jgi:hypothetical protein
VSLTERLTDPTGELMVFALTPPRLSSTAEDVARVAASTRERVAALDLDAVILYDIDEEADRNPDERPFPFLPTLDPADYRSLIEDWPVPAIVYRAVGKYSEDELTAWLAGVDPERTLSVFVGASSHTQAVPTTLARAQELRASVRPDLRLGGVTIPERHARRGDEHERLLAKQAAGTSFFVTQVVYDVNAAKNLVADYHRACTEAGTTPVPIVFTFSVCGSLKTLEFLRWLGVAVPPWIDYELTRAGDVLAASYDQAVRDATDLIGYCRRVGQPFGLNVESVSSRRTEIDASVQLAGELGLLLRR